MQVEHKNHMDALSNSAVAQCYQASILKSEHQVTKMHAHMCDKEITHLEAENAKDHAEAKKIYAQMMESKRMDSEVLQEEARIIALKVQLAQLNASLGSSSNAVVATSGLSMMDLDTTPGLSSSDFPSTITPDLFTGTCYDSLPG